MILVGAIGSPIIIILALILARPGIMSSLFMFLVYMLLFGSMAFALYTMIPSRWLYAEQQHEWVHPQSTVEPEPTGPFHNLHWSTKE